LNVTETAAVRSTGFQRRWSSALQWPQAEVGHQLGAELQLATGVVDELEVDELRQVLALVLV